jgi:hypothetical protein
VPLDPACGPPDSATGSYSGGDCEMGGFAAAYDIAWTVLLVAVALVMAWALFLCVRKLTGVTAIVSAVVTLLLPGIGAVIVVVLYYARRLPQAGIKAGSHREDEISAAI